MSLIYSFMILALLFASGSMFGWLLELFYRRFKPANKDRIWINPGFLNGPCLPLYGFGLTALYLMALLERFIPIDDPAARKAVLFVVMAAAMTIIELIAGELFIVRRHIKLWDYSELRFNYKGIICPRFSFYWAILGAGYYFFIHPRILSGLEWFSHNLLFSFVIGFFYGILTIDLVRSFSLTAKIKAFAAENRMIIRYDELKKHIRYEAKKRCEKYRFLNSMHSERQLIEELRTYMEKQIEQAKNGKLSDMIAFIKKEL
ncbi:putative ABC transporter permease [Ruminococcus sp.]|uniref:putative ABC transporter permease n=1 Tax=Ruminococcus sp. TaxID=41978 RepID=UPI00258885BF|nr:putative ABC transporter permease [Ruminococcus sp.]MCR5022423.1 putative ABC transporter permease [Ruminococcus sp.]